MGLVIERDVANWIANQGGWVSVCLYIVRSFKQLYKQKYNNIYDIWVGGY